MMMLDGLFRTDKLSSYSLLLKKINIEIKLKVVFYKVKPHFSIKINY